MPELATAWVTLAASTRGMEQDIAQALARAEKAAKLDPQVDVSKMAAQGDKAGRGFGEKFTGAAKIDPKVDVAKLASQGEKAGQGFGGKFTNAAKSEMGRLEGAARSGGNDAGDSFAAGFGDGLGGGKLPDILKGKLLGGGLAAIGVAAGKFLADSIGEGMEKMRTLDLFQARLGLDDATMSKLGLAAGDAYANQFGASIESNLQAAQFAIQAKLIDPKATEADIQKVIEQVQTLTAVMGADSREVARGARNLVSTGLVDTTEHAFDLMVVGSQKGLDLTADLIDTLEEYGTKFRDVGLTGADALGLISQALIGGARNTDVAADGIKEFAINVSDGSELTKQAFKDLKLDSEEMARKFAEGGPAARQAMAQVLEALTSIQDPMLRNQVGLALFKTKWEDMGRAVQALNLNTAATDLGKIDGASQQAAAQVGAHADQWDRLGRNISTAFDKFKTGLASSGFGQFFSTVLPQSINDLFFGTNYGQPQSPAGPNINPFTPPPVTPPAATPPSATIPGVALPLPGVTVAPTPGLFPAPPGLSVPPGYHWDSSLGTLVPNADGSIRQYGFGKLPSQALIQPATAGLVQWAEPSTHGEAFIPLAPSKRGRSMNIWAATGKLLGAFEDGAITGLTRDIVDQFAAQFGLHMTSGDRNEPGSYHGIPGGAGDFSNSSENTDQMLAFANFMADNFGPYLDELIYQDPRFAKTIKDGHVVGPFGAYYTEAQAGHHRDHVHVAFGKLAKTYQGQRASVPLSSLTASSSQQDVASAIIGEAQRRGFSREQTIAVLSTAMQESGLNPTASGGWGAWHGIFQQDTSYPGRDNPATNISGFFNRLGAPGGDIWKQIFALQQGQPYETGRQAYLTEIQSKQGEATRLYDTLAQTATSLDLFRTSVDGTTESVDNVKDTTSKATGTSGGESLGQAIVSGMLQTIGLDGSLFSNPFEWPNVKSGMALLNFGAGLLRGPSTSSPTIPGGAASAIGLPNIADFLTPIGPQALQPDAAHIGSGAAPGPSVVVNGDVGMDPRAFTQRVDAAQNQAWRRNMPAVIPG